MRDREKHRAWDRAYYAANREKRLARDKVYKRPPAVLARKRASSKSRYLRIREKRLAYFRAYYSANRKECAALIKAWRAANREKCYETYRAWRAANFDKISAKQALRLPARIIPEKLLQLQIRYQKIKRTINANIN